MKLADETPIFLFGHAVGAPGNPLNALTVA